MLRALHAARRHRHQSVPHATPDVPTPRQRAHGAAIGCNDARGIDARRSPRFAARCSRSAVIRFSTASTRRAVTKRDAIVAMADGRIVDRAVPRPMSCARLPPGTRSRTTPNALDHRRLHRRARALPAAAGDRRGRQAAARLADGLHVSRRGSASRTSATRARSRARYLAREPAARHHDGRRVRHRAPAVGRCRCSRKRCGAACG